MNNFKYKVGDRVKIQSLERYNKYKNRYGNINYGCETEILFTSEMSSFCGQVATITRVRYIGCVRFYHLAEDKEAHLWVDGMFERLVERNGKTYPYKIGDRVVLKGNNRSATITDLKYNSFGNLSYYIKIYNDKDISVDCPTDLLLPYDNKIRGFEEEIKPPKFKVGDRITNGKVTLTILTLSFDRYVVEDNFGKCGTLYFNTQDDWKIVEEETQSHNNMTKPTLTENSIILGPSKIPSDKELQEIWDEHLMEDETKPKMVNLDDVCEWIEKHIFDFPWYDNEYGDFSSKDVANALRKAMEK